MVLQRHNDVKCFWVHSQGHIRGRGEFWTLGMGMIDGQHLPATLFQRQHRLDLLGGVHPVSRWAVQAVFDGVNGRYHPRRLIPSQQPTSFLRVTRLQMAEEFFEQRPFNR